MQLSTATVANRLRSLVVTTHQPIQFLDITDEVAELVSWLLSPTAGYINGALIPVDGGASLLDVGMMEFQR